MTKILKAGERLKIRRKIPVKYFFIFLFLILLIVLFGVARYGIYTEHWYHGTTRSIVKIIPIKVGRVEKEKILYSQVVELANVIERDESVKDPFMEAMRSTVDRKLILLMAKELGVGVDQDKIKQYDYDINGLNDFLTELNWKKKDYEQYIVEPLLIAQAVEDEIKRTGRYQETALANIKSIQDNLSLGVPFKDLARQYSDDETANDNGFFGYVTQGELPQGLEKVFEMEVGDISEVMQAEKYFALVYLEDVIYFEGDRQKVAFRIITVKKGGLDSALEEFRRGKDIEIFVK